MEKFKMNWRMAIIGAIAGFMGWATTIQSTGIFPIPTWVLALLSGFGIALTINYWWKE